MNFLSKLIAAWTTAKLARIIGYLLILIVVLAVIAFWGSPAMFWRAAFGGLLGYAWTRWVVPFEGVGRNWLIVGFVVAAAI